MDTSDQKPRAEQLSKTPSWIMLGFLLGGVFVFTVQHEFFPPSEPAAAPAPARPASSSSSSAEYRAAPTPAQRQPLYALEDIFETYKQHALWEYDTTEVAFFNPLTDSCTEYVEVLRVGEKFYFRTIPRLTRPVVDRGLGPSAPIVFTEPQAMRDERRQQDLPLPRFAPPEIRPLPAPTFPKPEGPSLQPVPPVPVTTSPP
jgi:hypothetical protein